MEILKQLLSQTFNNQLNRLEKRSTQQLKDLQFTGVAFIKQGKQLEKLALMKKEDKSIKKKAKATDNIKRDISATTMRSRDNRRNIHKEIQEKKVRSNTPDFNMKKGITRNKTPLHRIDILKGKHYKTKTESTIPSHIDKKPTNHKQILSTPVANNTPNKVNPAIKKKKDKDKKEKEIILNTSTSNENLCNNLSNTSIDNSNNTNHNISNCNNNDYTNSNCHDTAPIKLNKDIKITKVKEQIVNLPNTDMNIEIIDKEIIIQKPPQPESSKIESIIQESPILIINPISIYSKLNIEQAIKENYDQPSFLMIIQYLTLKDKLNLFSSMKCFKSTLISLINEMKKKYGKNYKLTCESSLNNRINEMRLKYKTDQLNYSIPPFQITRGAVKAVELLNDVMYNRIYHQTNLQPPLNQIILVYRIFFQLLNIEDICSIENDNDFWVKASAYILSHSNGQTGTFFSQTGSLFDFSSQNILKISRILSGKEENIKPTFFSQVCGTTGLVVFLIKDALEYCGVLYIEKKTIPALFYQRLLYMKSIEERVQKYIDYINGI